MCQVYTWCTYASSLAPGKTDCTACHPRETTTYTLHVVFMTTHTHGRRKPIGKKEQRTNKKKTERKKKRRKRKKKTKKEKKEKKRQEKQEKTRQEKESRKEKEKKMSY